MLKLRYDTEYGSRYQYLLAPATKFYLDYSTLDTRDAFEPARYRYWYPHYWPSHLLEYIPTEHSLRKLRVKNNLYDLRT
ncbi:unnamed protein product [Phyllotreta striolata]|uniref:Uncharacterized protein n=1 Tax=Phyllotreta striolata TaxID=444603 RepID=A0A9N9XMX5_PHYSR|nr:unnamed protein product [Phyllotreta striolata]